MLGPRASRLWLHEHGQHCSAVVKSADMPAISKHVLSFVHSPAALLRGQEHNRASAKRGMPGYAAVHQSAMRDGALCRYQRRSVNELGPPRKPTTCQSWVNSCRSAPPRGPCMRAHARATHTRNIPYTVVHAPGTASSRASRIQRRKSAAYAFSRRGHKISSASALSSQCPPCIISSSCPARLHTTRKMNTRSGHSLSLRHGSFLPTIPHTGNISNTC